LSARSW